MSEKSLLADAGDDIYDPSIEKAAEIAIAEGLAPEDSDGLGVKHFLNPR